ncbi:MAG: hypothetical protein H0T78_04045 [Longispora sp.]|nr:hypothetical protein [Longispora sp. (in: high G+C Gram-positive bacteria)]
MPYMDPPVGPSAKPTVDSIAWDAYAYATQRFPSKPLMLADWGVWYSDTPCDQRCLNSKVSQTTDGLTAYSELGNSDTFNVTIK